MSHEPIVLPIGFRLAKAVAPQSDYRIKIGAALYMKKTLLSVGFNSLKSHPVVAGEDEFLSRHAECDALRRARFYAPGGTMYVYREYKDGKPAMAKPCESCMKFIYRCGVSTVYYTTSSPPYYEKLEL